MSGAPAAVVRGLWESFPVAACRAATLKELLSRPRVPRRSTPAWALQDVSFEVRAHEIVGLVGANGAGKSTLLRCVGGILPASRGEVLVRDRVVTLLELEHAFHPELTGRDNALVVGSLFGVPRRELLRRLDDVATFGELDTALDREVRTYSSGTRVRLAVALGLELRPDLLLIDEYLAGADEAFRQRSNARLAELRDAGTSAIVVSHEPALLEALCDRCMLLEDGRLAADGHTTDVLDGYLRRHGRRVPPAVSA